MPLKKGTMEVVLFKNTALFVPSKSISSMRGEKIIKIMLHFCFVDASNLNSVKISLSFDSLLNKNSFSENLLTQLNDPRFNYNMERNIKTLSNYDEYKKPKIRSYDNIMMNIQDVELNYRNLQKRKKQQFSFSDWQSEATWNHKIICLQLILHLR